MHIHLLQEAVPSFIFNKSHVCCWLGPSWSFKGGYTGLQMGISNFVINICDYPGLLGKAYKLEHRYLKVVIGKLNHLNCLKGKKATLKLSEKNAVIIQMTRVQRLGSMLMVMPPYADLVCSTCLSWDYHDGICTEIFLRINFLGTCSIQHSASHWLSLPSIISRTVGMYLILKLYPQWYRWAVFPTVIGSLLFQTFEVVKLNTKPIKESW